MKIISRNLFILLILAFIYAFSLQSCSKKDDLANTLERPQLIMYSPVSDTIGISVTFVWNRIQNANYKLETSNDSLLFTNGTKTFDLGDTTKWTVKGLRSNERFSARLKAVSKDGNIKDSEFSASTLRTIENIFTSQTNGVVAAANITASTVKLTWAAGKNVTSILQTTGGVNSTILLDATDISAKTKTISGLTSATNYVFKIQYNDMIRGTVTAITK
jgi:hypothetical protein